MKWALAAAAIVIVSLMAGLALSLRSTTSPKASAPNKNEPATSPASSALAQPPTKNPALRQVEATVGETPSEPSLEQTVDEKERLRIALGRNIPRTIIATAGECYQGEPGAQESMKVKYRLVMKGGQGLLENVEMVESEWDAPRLEGCVLNKLRELKLSEEMPDFTEDMDQDLTIVGLKKAQRRRQNAEAGW